MILIAGRLYNESVLIIEKDRYTNTYITSSPCVIVCGLKVVLVDHLYRLVEEWVREGKSATRLPQLQAQYSNLPAK
jgi:hypothetical protein